MFGYDTLRKRKMSDTNLPQLTTGRAFSPSHTEGDEDQSLSSRSAAVKRTGVKKKAHSEGSREGSVAQPHHPSTTTASAATVVVVNNSATGPSGRSSVSSLASSGSYSGQHHYHHHHHHQQSLNQALAIVANKWDREQRRQEQEITRRLTLLKQRKVSAVLKVGDDVFFRLDNLIWRIIYCHKLLDETKCQPSFVFFLLIQLLRKDT